MTWLLDLCTVIGVVVLTVGGIGLTVLSPFLILFWVEAIASALTGRNRP